MLLLVLSPLVGSYSVGISGEVDSFIGCDVREIGFVSRQRFVRV